MALVQNPNRIRLAMLGMNEGNGHPYSWTAIINGRYDADAMAQCGYPVIPRYLNAQPPRRLGLAGVEVTHVHCDRPEDAAHVARCGFVPYQLVRPEDAIGKVDAVIIATDIGSEHVERARPFIDAGVPVFIDKPLADNADDLNQFVAWYRAGKAFHSSSSMRYVRQFQTMREQLATIGTPRMITMTMANSWARYGMHALEAVYPFLQPGQWLDVVNTGNASADQVHIRHASGVDVLLSVVRDLGSGAGWLSVYGSEGKLTTQSDDTFGAFKQQLVQFVDYLRTGIRPFTFQQTVELTMLLIGGELSLREGGRRVALRELPVHDMNLE